MTTQILRSAIAGLAFTAMACGGSETPPGGRNGNDTADGGDETANGTTGNGGRTDGPYIPNPNNPLIRTIPGTWRHTLSDGQPPKMELLRELTVDSTDPDCEDYLWVSRQAECEAECASSGTSPCPPCELGFEILHPMGDACVSLGGRLFVLADDLVYWDTSAPNSRLVIRDGWVLDAGTRLRYTIQAFDERELPPYSSEWEKVR